MASVRLEGSRRRTPTATWPRAALDLAIADGEFMVLVGPSGCGKSTALRMIAGPGDADAAGRVLIGDRDVTAVPPQERDIAMVFQSYALYPHMTVRRQPGFGLRMRGAAPAAIAERVDQAAEVRWGSTAVLDRKPGQLSGRPAAAGRAGPGDRAGAEGVPVRRAALQSRRQAPASRPAPSWPGCTAGWRATIVYVTHDQEEALTLGDAGRGDARRDGGAGGAADGGLPPAGDAVRRRASSARRP